MAIKKFNPTGGLRLWWDTSIVGSAWLELGPEKAKAFVAASNFGKTFLLLIPPPWGPLAFGLASAKLKQIKGNMGPKGVWVKFNLAGYVKSRPRTDANKQRTPSPW